MGWDLDGREGWCRVLFLVTVDGPSQSPIFVRVTRWDHLSFSYACHSIKIKNKSRLFIWAGVSVPDVFPNLGSLVRADSGLDCGNKGRGQTRVLWLIKPYPISHLMST